MTHDPLCPFRPAPPEEYAPIEVAVACQCDLIAKVRADERERVLAEGPYFTSVVHDCCVELQKVKDNS